MRDPARIHEIVTTLEQLWNKYPDFRFWQLLSVIPVEYKNDLFYCEDYITKAAFEKALKEGF